MFKTRLKYLLMRSFDYTAKQWREDPETLRAWRRRSWPIWKEPLNNGRSWSVLAASVKLRLPSTLVIRRSTLASGPSRLIIPARSANLAMVVVRSLPFSSGEEAVAGGPLLCSVIKPGIGQGPAGSEYAFL